MSAMTRGVLFTALRVVSYVLGLILTLAFGLYAWLRLPQWLGALLTQVLTKLALHGLPILLAAHKL